MLAWPAYEGLSVPITYDLLAELSPQRPSVQGHRALLQHYFPLGETGPDHRAGPARHEPIFGTAKAATQISRLTTELHDLSYVDSRGRESAGRSSRCAA